MKCQNFFKMGVDHASSGHDVHDALSWIGGDLSCEERPKRSFKAVMRSLDLYQEGWMRGMEKLREEAMREFSDERQRMMDDEAERVEKKIEASKKK